MADDDDLIGDLPEPTSRRGFLIAGGGLAAAGVVGWLAFGRKHGDAAGAGAAGPPRQGGELAFAFDGAAITKFGLDPHNSGFAPHNRVIRSIYDNLTVLNPDGSVGPWLAESWDVSADQTRYVFKLRPDVTFHDGTPFDAAAAKANFDRLADRTNALTSRPAIGPYLGSQAIDAHRLEVRLSEPFAPLLRNLSMTKLSIVSPAAVAKHGATYGQNPVGTGPFRFAGLTQGTEIRLERNAGYKWAPASAANQGAPYLEKLTFRNVPEEATRVAVLRSGQVQGADLVPPQNIGDFRDNPAFALQQKELLETNYSLLLNSSKAPWDDEDVRRAVRLSLDIDRIVQVIYLGTFKRAWSSLSPSMFGSAELQLANSWAPDPRQAAAILDGKGWRRGADGIRVKDGQRLSISLIDSQGNREKRLDVIHLARRQLADNGIELKVDSQASGAYAAKVAEGAYDMTAGASFHADPDILRSSFDPTVRSSIAGNRVNDPEIVEWLRAAAREGDGTARAALYEKVQRRIVDKAYSIPVYVLLYNLVTARGVQGVTLDAHGFPEFQSAWVAA